MNYKELCKCITELHKNIEVAIVLSSNKLIASHIKTGGPLPDDREFSGILSQIERIIRITKANEDTFGSLEFVIIHYKFIDGLLFPLDMNDTLVVGIVQPYEYDILNKILTVTLQREVP
jgi:hypothetical protein